MWVPRFSTLHPSHRISRQIVTRVLLNKPKYTEGLNQTPYFSGIIAGSIVWVLYSWITRLIPSKYLALSLLQRSLTMRSRYPRSPIHSLLICYHRWPVRLQLFPRHYAWSRHVPKTFERWRAEIRESGFVKSTIHCNESTTQIIEDLASDGRLNGQTFCIQCMVMIIYIWCNICMTISIRLGNPSAPSIVVCVTSA